MKETYKITLMRPEGASELDMMEWIKNAVGRNHKEIRAVPFKPDRCVISVERVG